MSDFSTDFDPRSVGWWQRRSVIRRLKHTAWLAGADRDLRVQRARAAQSRGELNALTRDLAFRGPAAESVVQGAAYSVPGTQAYGQAPQAPPVMPHPPQPTASKRSLRSSLLIVGVVLLVTCGGGLVSCVSAIVDTVSESTSSSESTSGSSVDLLSEDGWNEMIETLDEGIDIRAVVDLVVRPDAATVQLPDGDDTVLNYYYDGDVNLADNTARNPARVPFDLTMVDGSLVATTVDAARAGSGVEASAEAWVRIAAKTPDEPTIIVTFPGAAGSYSLEVALDGTTVAQVS